MLLEVGFDYCPGIILVNLIDSRSSLISWLGLDERLEILVLLSLQLSKLTIQFFNFSKLLSSVNVLVVHKFSFLS